MKHSILTLMLMVVAACNISYAATPVKKIAYKAQKQAEQGVYTVKYYDNEMLWQLTNSAAVSFDNFTGENYVLTYPSQTGIAMTTFKGAVETASYNFEGKGGLNYGISYTIKNVGSGSGNISKDSSDITFTTSDGKNSLTIKGENKFKGLFNVEESTLNVNGVKAKLKIKYSPYPYEVFAYGFDYMSFIISEFLGIKFGIYDAWPCPGMCFMENYPSEIEVAGQKYVFDYAPSMKHIEIKRVVNNKMQERYIFDIEY